jgi:hypothetical protein
MTKKEIRANKGLYTVAAVSKDDKLYIKVLEVNDDIRKAFLKEGTYIDFANKEGVVYTEKCFCHKTKDDAEAEANKMIEHNKN